MTSTSATQFIHRGDGRIAYDVRGEGPLVLLSPGMGDLRSTYRFLAPALVDAGYRVATADLRGHGESDADFRDYGDAATAGDLLALIDHLGQPAVIVGNSMSAGAAVIAAATEPQRVAGLVLTGPFVRPASVNPVMALMFRIMMAPAWAAAAWHAYLPQLYAGALPDDFADYRAAVRDALKRPGHARAFSLTTHADHEPAHQSIAAVQAPTLVLMGDRDPDFPDPKAEAEWVAAALKGTSQMVADAGHYPHAQQPAVTAAAILRFLASALPPTVGTDRA